MSAHRSTRRLEALGLVTSPRGPETASRSSNKATDRDDHDEAAPAADPPGPSGGVPDEAEEESPCRLVRGVHAVVQVALHVEASCDVSVEVRIDVPAPAAPSPAVEDVDAAEADDDDGGPFAPSTVPRVVTLMDVVGAALRESGLAAQRPAQQCVVRLRGRQMPLTTPLRGIIPDGIFARALRQSKVCVVADGAASAAALAPVVVASFHVYRSNFPALPSPARLVLEAASPLSPSARAHIVEAASPSSPALALGYRGTGPFASPRRPLLAPAPSPPRGAIEVRDAREAIMPSPGRGSAARPDSSVAADPPQSTTPRPETPARGSGERAAAATRQTRPALTTPPRDTPDRGDELRHEDPNPTPDAPSPAYGDWASQEVAMADQLPPEALASPARVPASGSWAAGSSRHRVPSSKAALASRGGNGSGGTEVSGVADAVSKYAAALRSDSLSLRALADHGGNATLPRDPRDPARLVPVAETLDRRAAAVRPASDPVRHWIDEARDAKQPKSPAAPRRTATTGADTAGASSQPTADRASSPSHRRVAAATSSITSPTTAALSNAVRPEAASTPKRRLRV